MNKFFAVLIGIIGFHATFASLESDANAPREVESTQSKIEFAGLVRAFGHQLTEALNMTTEEIAHVRHELVKIISTACKQYMTIAASMIENDINSERYKIYFGTLVLEAKIFDTLSNNDEKLAIVNMCLGLALLGKAFHPVLHFLEKMIALNKISPAVARNLHKLLVVAICSADEKTLEESGRLISFLLQTCKVDPDRDDTPLKLPLHRAVEHWHLPAIQALLTAGATTDQEEPDLRYGHSSSPDTVLIKAIRYWRKEESEKMRNILVPWVSLAEVESSGPVHRALKEIQHRHISPIKEAFEKTTNDLLVADLQDLVMQFSYGENYPKMRFVDQRLVSQNRRLATLFALYAAVAFYFDDAYIATLCSIGAITYWIKSISQ